MPGRKLKLVTRLEKEQKVYGGLKYREKVNSKAKHQKEINEETIKKYTESKALFAKKIIEIQNKLSNPKSIINFNERQETRKEIIALIKNRYIKQNIMKLPDSTLYSLGTIEQKLELLHKSHQYDKYLENIDKDYTTGFLKLMKGNYPEKITDLVNKVGVAIMLHSEFLEKRINFEKKAKAKEE